MLRRELLGNILVSVKKGGHFCKLALIFCMHYSIHLSSGKRKILHAYIQLSNMTRKPPIVLVISKYFKL